MKFDSSRPTFGLPCRPFGFLLLAAITASAPGSAEAEDWPQWRGPDRLGVWTETGIVDRFGPDGPAIRWRTPIKAGYAGPAVSDGKVFITDFERTKGYLGAERALALDEKTGEVLWTAHWEADYKGMLRSWANGPRSTPTVDGDRVYVFGAASDLLCLNTEDGTVLWQRNFIRDDGAAMPIWGFSGAPLVDGDRLICLAGATPDGKIVALDKKTGREIWRAVAADSGLGYSQPVIFDFSGGPQLIIWNTDAIHGLNPETGAILWEQPFAISSGLTVATPVRNGNRVFVSAFYNGSMMVELDGSGGGAKMLWKGTSDSEVKPDGLHSLISTPVFDGENIYGVCSYGHLRCLDAETGEELWATLEPTGEARWSNAFLVRHEDRYFLNNEHGDLIIAKLSPEGYEEISRAKLIEPTTPSRQGSRGSRLVNWVHPAYANGHIVIRNDTEIISASLLAD